MIANCAFLAAMMLVLVLFVVAGELQFLAPYKRLILGTYLWTIVGALVLLFLNLFGVFYTIGRTLFLKETGRKLAPANLPEGVAARIRLTLRIRPAALRGRLL